MSLSKVSNTNLEALQQSLQQLNQSAKQISRLPEDLSVDLTHEIVVQKFAQRSAKAQLNVIRVQKELHDFLIDELA